MALESRFSGMCPLGITEKQLDIIVRRSLGATLEEIGQDLGCTRENVRLLEKKALSHLGPIKERLAHSLNVMGERWAAIESDLVEKMPEDLMPHSSLVSYLLGLKTVTIFETRWVILSEPVWLCEVQARLPLLEEELAPLVGFQPGPEMLDLIAHLANGQVEAGLGIIRSRGKQRDKAYLVLLRAGKPVDEASLAECVGLTIRNLRAQLVRDHRFTRNLALGLVGLKEWNLADYEIKTAKQSLVQVLETEGPLTQTTLIRKAIAVFPRTYSRYIQVLEDPDFGVLEDGRIDLCSRGANSALDTEPPVHHSVIEHSERYLSVFVKVTPDLLRGAGVPVHKRLGWVLGIRSVGESKVFITSGRSKITVKRFPGNLSLSSMRGFADVVSAKPGCELEIAFDKFEGRCDVRPSCSCHPPSTIVP